jgi:hypothetical protein
MTDYIYHVISSRGVFGLLYYQAYISSLSSTHATCLDNLPIIM